VWLPASVPQQLARLERDRKRPLLAAPDREERLQQMAALRNPLYAEVADLKVNTTSESVTGIARELAQQLEGAWQRAAAPHAA
jgi:shikimate kinase